MFDFSVHPVAAADEDALFDLSRIDIAERLAAIERDMTAQDFDGGLVSFYDANIFRRDADRDAVARAIGRGFFAAAYMPDLADAETADGLEAAREAGCCAIVFHPYLQDIGPPQMETVARLCHEAQRLGMFVCVCAAYGGLKIYRIDPMHTVDCAARSTDMPVVVVHGGGRRVLDAMLIADMHPHVMLETSYSLPYWLGSSVETDFAFAMKKIGPGRWLFGSDTPFMETADVVRKHLNFFERHGFNVGDIDRIMGLNAKGLPGVCEKGV